MIGVYSYFVYFACVVLVLAVLTLGLNLQWGYTGLFNAGIVGFYAIGAYTHAILTAAPKPELMVNLALPWIAGILAAMIASAVAAWVIGIATIKLRDDYLAIATFGIAVTIQLVTKNWEHLTGGGNGITGIARPFFESLGTPLAFNTTYLLVLVAIVSIIYWALERIVRSPWGRVLKAIREDETAAIALGKDAARFRLQAFVLGSTLMGLAGALYVSLVGFVGPDDFQPILTFQIWAMLIVGGSGNNRGAILGALVVWAIWALSGIAITKFVPPDYAKQGGAIQVILIGLMLVASIMFRPRGLIGEKPVVSRHADE
jgi:branched-chain amino acid transport system permease protein